jgi:hypothetical protein
MKKENQTKKLSLKKTQIIKINDLKKIVGGLGITNNGFQIDNGENDDTVSTKPPVTYTGR